jgi:hypothetical protein
MKNEIKKSGKAFLIPLGLSGKSWEHIKNLKRFLKFKYSDNQIYFINNKHIQNEITNTEISTFS